jgi:hypothetical protein
MPASSSESTQPLSTPTAIVIHPTEGRTLTAFGSTLQFKLEGSHTRNSLTLGLAITPPPGSPLHVPGSSTRGGPDQGASGSAP